MRGFLGLEKRFGKYILTTINTPMIFEYLDIKTILTSDFSPTTLQDMIASDFLLLTFVPQYIEKNEVMKIKG